MKKIKEFFADMTETVSVTKLDGTLIVAIAALSGVIIGMLISPRKMQNMAVVTVRLILPTMEKMTGTGMTRIQNKNCHKNQILS